MRKFLICLTSLFILMLTGCGYMFGPESEDYETVVSLNLGSSCNAEQPLSEEDTHSRTIVPVSWTESQLDYYLYAEIFDGIQILSDSPLNIAPEKMTPASEVITTKLPRENWRLTLIAVPKSKVLGTVTKTVLNDNGVLKGECYINLKKNLKQYEVFFNMTTNGLNTKGTCYGTVKMTEFPQEFMRDILDSGLYSTKVDTATITLRNLVDNSVVTYTDGTEIKTVLAYGDWTSSLTAYSYDLDTGAGIVTKYRTNYSVSFGDSSKSVNPGSYSLEVVVGLNEQDSNGSDYVNTYCFSETVIILPGVDSGIDFEIKGKIN